MFSRYHLFNFWSKLHHQQVMCFAKKVRNNFYVNKSQSSMNNSGFFRQSDD